MSVYLEEFNNWNDVLQEFALPANTPEPADVFAAYEIDSNEGYAVVIIRKPNNLFDVIEGYHCSCYGLEGQFEPTEDVPLDALKKMFHTHIYDAIPRFKHEIREWLAKCMLQLDKR